MARLQNKAKTSSHTLHETGNGKFKAIGESFNAVQAWFFFAVLQFGNEVLLKAAPGSKILLAPVLFFSESAEPETEPNADILGHGTSIVRSVLTRYVL